MKQTSLAVRLVFFLALGPLGVLLGRAEAQPAQGRFGLSLWTFNRPATNAGRECGLGQLSDERLARMQRQPLITEHDVDAWDSVDGTWLLRKEISARLADSLRGRCFLLQLGDHLKIAGVALPENAAQLIDFPVLSISKTRSGALALQLKNGTDRQRSQLLNQHELEALLGTPARIHQRARSLSGADRAFRVSLLESHWFQSLKTAVVDHVIRPGVSRELLLELLGPPSEGMLRESGPVTWKFDAAGRDGPYLTAVVSDGVLQTHRLVEDGIPGTRRHNLEGLWYSSLGEMMQLDVLPDDALRIRFRGGHDPQQWIAQVRSTEQPAIYEFEFTPRDEEFRATRAGDFGFLTSDGYLVWLMENPSARSPEGPRSPVKVWRRIYAEQPSRVCENDSLALRVDFLSDLTAKLLIKDKASGSEMACNASFDARSICTGCQGIFYEQIYEKRGSCAVVGSDPDSVPVAPVADTEPQYISIPQTSLRLYGDLPRIRYAGTGGTLQSLMCTP